MIPKPLQKPHPPLWVACSNIRTIGEAGQWGMGALGFSFVSPEAARAWVHRYYNNLLHRPKQLTDYPTNPNIAIVNGFMCAPTDEEAIEARPSGWTFFIFALGYYGRKGIDAPGTGNLWREYQDWRQTDKAKQALRNGLIGSPETIRKQAAPVRGGACRSGDPAQPGGRTSHQAICDSLELFAREVMPEFHAARAGAAMPGRRDVLAGRDRARGPGDRSLRPLRHQNEDIVRLTPEQLKQRMAEKERAAQGA